MNLEIKECKSFEDDEHVFLGLSVQDEKTIKGVLNCLYKLYADDCVRWLIKNEGGKSGGESTVHNAHHAFSDSLLAIHNSVKEQRFKPDGRPNSSRRFLYFVSLRYYKRLQVKKYKSYSIIPDDDSEVYSKPNFEFPVEKEEKNRKLHQIIKNMPEKCREILWLKYVDGDTTEEIAMKMQMNEQQVFKKLYDCREKFKQYISDGFNENY